MATEAQPLHPDWDFREHGVTCSMLNAWNECKRKGLFQTWGAGSVRLKEPFAYGGIGHDVLEKFYKLWAKNRKEKKNGRLNAMNCVTAAAAKYKKKNGLFWIESEEERFEKLLAQLYGVIPEWVNFAVKHGYREIDYCGIEEKFDLPFETASGVMTRIRGRYDLLREFEGGDTFLIDHKFKGRIDSNMLDALQYDEQLNYYMAALAITLGRPPGGCAHYIIRRPQLQIRKGENFKQYAGRIAIDAKKRPEFYYMPVEVAISPQQVADYTQELRVVLDEFREWTEAGCPTRTYGQPCFGKYGKCDYVNACHDGMFKEYRSWRYEGREDELWTAMDEAVNHHG